MTELDPELTADEYEQRLDEAARHTLVLLVQEDRDYIDTWEVHDFLLGAFHEDYPVSILKHSSIDPTHDDVRGFIEGRPPQHPLEELVDIAQATLANDVVRYIEKSLIEESDLVDVDPDATNPIESASLTEQGQELL